MPYRLVWQHFRPAIRSMDILNFFDNSLVREQDVDDYVVVLGMLLWPHGDQVHIKDVTTLLHKHVTSDLLLHEFRSLLAKQKNTAPSSVPLYIVWRKLKRLHEMCHTENVLNTKSLGLEEPILSADGGLHIAILLRQAACMSGMSILSNTEETFTTGYVYITRLLMSTLYLDLGHAMSTAFRLWHLLNTLVEEEFALIDFHNRLNNGNGLGKYSIYNIRMLFQSAAKILSNAISTVEGTYRKSALDLQTCLIDAQYILHIMTRPDRSPNEHGLEILRLRARIHKEKEAIGRSDTGDKIHQKKVSYYTDLLALLDKSIDDVKLVVEQRAAEHNRVAARIAIFDLYGSYDRVYIPVCDIAQHLPELLIHQSEKKRCENSGHHS